MKHDLRLGTYSLAIAATLGTLLATGLGCAGVNNTTLNIGTITAVAGTGTFGYSGNGGPATSAELYQPTCAVLDTAGNLYIGDVVTNTVRRVAAGTGIISLYAGNGIAASSVNHFGAYSGDGGAATAASMYGPTACALDSASNLYVADEANNAIRKIDASSGIITTVVGNGVGAGTSSGGFSGDGGPATMASINHPGGVIVDSAGDIFVSDTGNQRVREVNGATGIITTIAGNGQYGYAGNTGQAVNAMLGNPAQLALDSSGNLYIAEAVGAVVKLNLYAGSISTVAGTGATPQNSGDNLGDGGLATQAKLDDPNGVAVAMNGDIYISDSTSNRVAK